ncbi:MAG: aldo/keto reductase [Bryobacteraceae bacterium]|nr:aldo/keto reductase [Bryobacteraceae bacterium]
MKRRSFIVSSVAAAASAAPKSQVPKRPYKAGIELSIIGFGGIVATGMPQSEADRRVKAAYDRGVNYYDCAPSYADGEAEIKLGNALQGLRKHVFVAEKTQKRDAAGAQAELEQTLRRFHTDHVDLYQFHAVSSMKDVDQILAPGGAAEVFLKAKKEGKTRFLGFSAHDAAAAIRLMDALELDSILFPVNFNAWENGGFGPQMLQKAKSKGMARLALKALALGRWKQGAKRTHPKCWYEPVSDPALAKLALQFTLNQEITAAVPPGDEHIFDLALDLACGPLPKLQNSELARLSEAARASEPIFRV